MFWLAARRQQEAIEANSWSLPANQKLTDDGKIGSEIDGKQSPIFSSAAMQKPDIGAMRETLFAGHMVVVQPSATVVSNKDKR